MVPTLILYCSNSCANLVNDYTDAEVDRQGDDDRDPDGEVVTPYANV